jgi:hypothetical protein
MSNWTKVLLAECQLFSLLHVIHMANLIPACSLAGNWACWRIVCKVASCDPRLRRTTLSRTPWDELSAHPSDLNVTTHNTYKRQTSIMPGRIRTHNLSKPTAADPCPRPHSHWDQPFWHLVDTKYSSRSVLQRHCAVARNVCLSAIFRSLKFSVWKTDYEWEFIMYESVGCMKVKCPKV